MPDSARADGLLCRKYACALLLSMALASLTGCSDEKESLHELDHALPPHWPTDLADAADKLDERIEAIAQGQADRQIRKEVDDLVAWLPEVAGDTELTEADWLPIYSLSETLRKHLQATDVSIADIREDFDRLNQLLREANEQLATSRASMQHGSTNGDDESNLSIE